VESYSDRIEQDPVAEKCFERAVLLHRGVRPNGREEFFFAYDRSGARNFLAAHPQKKPPSNVAICLRTDRAIEKPRWTLKPSLDDRGDALATCIFAYKPVFCHGMLIPQQRR
jgi:hypothetical protein